MSATGYTPIKIYSSSTTTNVPAAGNLINDTSGSELAINITDGKLFYKDNAGVVQVIASKAGNVNVSSFSAGTTGLTPSTATTGAVTLAGTLVVANGGTGLTALTTGYIPYGNGAALGNSANLFFDASNKRLGVGTATPAVTGVFVGTDALLMPKGTTAQQPSGVAGYLRFNTDTTQFEGYNGTIWSSVGGAAISNDTSTATFEYPLFASATSGTALTVYTSNANFLYKPSTGELQAKEITASNGLILNASAINSSYTIGTGYNAMSVGPVTVASGQTVTVSSGQRWIVL